MVLDDDGNIYDQGDSKSWAPEWAFAHHVGSFARDLDYASIYIEDIPPGIRFDLPCKQVCRLQGAIMVFAAEGAERIHWTNVTEWKRHHKLPLRGGKTPQKELCLELGYRPPGHAHGKLLTDYRDAFLIATYAREVWKIVD